MNVKIDTKEKFTVITPEEAFLSANMTEELSNLLLPYIKQSIQHIVFNMSYVNSIDPVTTEKIASIQQEFYEQNCSFIVCELQETVENSFDENDLLELMNVTPTESEAWDIIQMEEIERELMNDFENDDEKSSI